jgi:hypothetical protein
MAKFEARPNPEEEKEKLAIISEKIEKAFLKDQEEFDTDDTEDIIESLSEALSIDYVEKWKVYARMKLAQRNFEKSEMMRKSLIQRLIQVQGNLDVTLKGLEDKKIALDFEIEDKMKLKEEIKSLKAEVKSLKNPKQVSKRLAPEKKSPAKNA